MGGEGSRKAGAHGDDSVGLAGWNDTVTFWTDVCWLVAFAV